METLTVPATLDSLKAIRDFVMKMARTAGLDRKTACHLRLGVDEIATNSIEHGYDDEIAADEQLFLSADIGRHTVTIILEDHGKAYDPRQVPLLDDFDLPLEERSTGGLGIFLTVHCIDQLVYERIGECNRMTFIMKRS